MMYQSHSFHESDNEDEIYQRHRSNRREQILKELEKMKLPDKQFSSEVKTELFQKLAKSDPDLKTEEAFKAMLKVYTHDSTFYNIGLRFQIGNFCDIQAYTATVLEAIQAHGSKYMYNNCNKPVFRGLSPHGSFNPVDFQLNSIGYFNKFSSSSTQDYVANRFSYRGQADRGTFDGELLRFRIFCTSKNEPRNHVKLDSPDWTFYPIEEEVNLLPFFQWQVSKIEQHAEAEVHDSPDSVLGKARITEITFVEIPFQNHLRFRRIEQSSIIIFKMEKQY